MNQLAEKLFFFLDKKTAVQLFRFLVTGTFGTLISYLTFIICLKIFHIHYIIANIIAFILSFIFNYNLNKKWSFEDKEKALKKPAKYLGLYLISLFLGSVILRISVESFNIIPEIGFIISLCFTTIFNFLGLKFCVFKN